MHQDSKYPVDDADDADEMLRLKYNATDCLFCDPSETGEENWIICTPEDSNGSQWRYTSTSTPDGRLVVTAAPTAKYLKTEAMSRTEGSTSVPEASRKYQTNAGPKAFTHFATLLHHQITHVRPRRLEERGTYAKVTLMPTYAGGISKGVGIEKCWHEVFRATLKASGKCYFTACVTDHQARFLPDEPSVTMRRFSYDPMNIHRSNGLSVKGSWPSHDPGEHDKSAYHEALKRLGCASLLPSELDKFADNSLMNWDVEPTVEGESRSAKVTVRDRTGRVRTAQLTLTVQLATLEDQNDLPIIGT